VTEVAGELGRLASGGARVGGLLSAGEAGGLVDSFVSTRACPHRCSAELNAVVCELRRPGRGALQIFGHHVGSRAAATQAAFDYVRWQPPGGAGALAARRNLGAAARRRHHREDASTTAGADPCLTEIAA